MADSVHKSDVSKIQLPELAIIEDRGLSLCKEPFPVLASISDSSYYKNDRTAVDGKFDSIDVYLEDESGNEELAPGTAVNYPNQSDAVGFIVDWRQYTEVVGGVTRLKAGCYKIKVYYDIAGITGHFYYGSYRLLPYTVQNAEGTSRIFVVLNGYVRETDIDYRDSGAATTFRFRGKFGDRQPNYDMEDITEISRVTYTVRNESINTYVLKSEPLLGCFTEKIDTNHLLVASQIFISDHSTYAHKQYYDKPVILDKEKSPEFEYDGMGVYAKITAYFKDKVKKREAKYSGDINGSTNAILDLPTGTQAEGCLAATVTINTNEITDTIVSGGSKNYNLLDQNGDTINVDSVTGDNVTLNTWWNRPTEWLDLPTITNTDNKSAGVYAVFEDGFNTVNIRLNLGNHSIVWGDGATSSGSGSNQDYQHTYDYSTLSGAVNVSDDGRNYKQVIIEADYDNDTNSISFNINTTPTFGSTPRSQGFLDQVFAKNTGGAELTIAWGDTPFIYGYLQRITCLGKTAPRSMRKLSALKVLKNDFAGRDLGNLELELSGDFRGDEVGTPINIINPDVISDVRSLFINSNISKFGNMDLSPTTGSNFNIFRFCTNLVEIGNIDFGNSVAINGTLSECYNLKRVGTITVSVNNTTLVIFAENAYQLASLIFAGDLSGVNNTLRAFNNCYNLRELLLPNITVGFDISDTQITGTPLQDLFTSLGTASGAQTITLPNFTMGESTAIATGKGYTIAYA